MIVSFDELRRVAFRALDGGGAAPGVDDEAGWACAWLAACGYPGLKMLGEALEETPREERRPSFMLDAIGVDLRNVSCLFAAPTLVDLAKARGRIFLRNVRHGLYLLPSRCAPILVSAARSIRPLRSAALARRTPM